jgi:small conductance mechanosensitive channel
MNETLTLVDQLIKWAWVYGPKLITAIAVFFGGLWVIRRLTNGFDAFLKNRKVDESLRPFFTSLADTGMKLALVLFVASTLGFEITSFIAIFSAIAFSVGLALQGSLGNFASGILILLFRPYKVSDLIKIGDFQGRVAEIQIFNTTLLTNDGRKIIIPNGKITEGPIETIADNIEVLAQISLLVKAETSIEWVRTTAFQVAEQYPYRLKEHPLHVKITGFNRDDTEFEIGFWVLGTHYEDATDYLYEGIKRGFEIAGIELAKERRREIMP